MALSLLELVTRAAQVEDAGCADSQSVWSVSLKPSVATTNQTKEAKAQNHGIAAEYTDDLITRETGEWHFGHPSKGEEALVDQLRKRREHLQTFTITEFVAMVRPVLENSARRADAAAAGPASSDDVRENGSVEGEGTLANSSKHTDQSDEGITLDLLRKEGAHLGRRLLALILQCSLSLRFYSAVRVLLECGLVSSNTHPQLVSKLVEVRQTSLLCLCLHRVLDLPPPDILTILKFFLHDSKPLRLSFEIVRQEWRKSASAAIDKAAKKKGLPIVVLSKTDAGTPKKQGHDQVRNLPKRKAKEKGSLMKAIGLAVSIDGFQGWEVCLHDMIASGQDEAVLAAVVGELDTGEAVRLLRYLHKWLDRYSKQLAHTPSPKSKIFGHKVPSLAQVLQWVSVVLDGQYTKFVLCSDFLPELRALQELIQSLVAIGTKFSPLAGVTEHIRSSASLPTGKRGIEAASDYIIEFLDIS